MASAPTCNWRDVLSTPAVELAQASQHEGRQHHRHVNYIAAARLLDTAHPAAALRIPTLLDFGLDMGAHRFPRSPRTAQLARRMLAAVGAGRIAAEAGCIVVEAGRIVVEAGRIVVEAGRIAAVAGRIANTEVHHLRRMFRLGLGDAERGGKAVGRSQCDASAHG